MAIQRKYRRDRETVAAGDDEMGEVAAGLLRARADRRV
jgi:hypothetical protein